MARTTYTRICKCGDIATIGYKPKPDTMCRACSAKARLYKTLHARWLEDYKKIRYVYFCPHCPTVVIRDAKKKTALCGKCSRQYSKKKNIPTYEWSYITMRYFRVCPDCPENNNIKEVSSQANAGIKKCKKHKESKPYKKYKRKAVVKKDKKVSKVAINKAKEENRKHREAMESLLPTPQQKSDEELMAEWLKKNKVKVLTPTTKFSDGREVNVKGW